MPINHSLCHTHTLPPGGDDDVGDGGGEKTAVQTADNFQELRAVVAASTRA